MMRALRSPYDRIQFNTMASYDARFALPKAALIKELSVCPIKQETAHKFVQVWLLQKESRK
jgi:hypothetical protein